MFQEQSPVDYVLYYKRATAYYSLSRHSVALDDFEKVLSLTSNSFDNALLMTAKIHTKDGRFSEAREALTKYMTKVPSDRTAQAMLDDVDEAERAANMMRKMQKAQLWAGCAEAASQALKVASHSSEIRAQRAQCSLASGDIESAVADQT
jgi:DnaJ homolog subfamily C member 3